MKKFFIGIDEAGRGPWAWPLVVAWVCTQDPFLLQQISFLNDSKKVAEKHREIIFDELKNLQQSGKVQIAICEKTAEEIDILWIREANRQAMNAVILELISQASGDICISIDGADNFIFDDIWDFDYIFAKKSRKKENFVDERLYVKNLWIFYGNFLWKKLQFVIGGDAIFPEISSASILAKVSRDMIMKQFWEIFPEYEFEKHKWYGTKKHREAILNYGINFLHRKSYAPIKALISEDY